MGCLNPGSLTEWKLSCNWAIVPPDLIGEIDRWPEHSLGFTLWAPKRSKAGYFFVVANQLLTCQNVWQQGLCPSALTMPLNTNQQYIIEGRYHVFVFFLKRYTSTFIVSICMRKRQQDDANANSCTHYVASKTVNDFFREGDDKYY